MKRHVDSAQTPSTPRKQPRQDPVSCQTCRKRKLKCDRKLPCSSCSARKLECFYANQDPNVSCTHALDQIPTERPGRERSEPGECGPVTIPKASSQVERSDDAVATVEHLESMVMGHWIPNAVPATSQETWTDEEQVVASQAHLNTSGPGHPYLPGAGPTIRRQNPCDIDLRSCLPARAEASSLFRYYCDHLDFQYHIILPQVVEAQIDTIYDRNADGGAINLSHAALLFSIVASSLFYKLQGVSSSQADICCKDYAFLTGAALMQSNYIAYPQLEGLQAAMIVAHNLSNTDLPPSVSSLFVHRLSVNQGINMSLHLTDCPQMVRRRAEENSDAANVELRRRVWWDLVSYDWLLSYLSGPQQWTYSVNAQHMNIRTPLNIEDQDAGSADSGAPLSVPTVMTYTLCRLELATVSRGIADVAAQQIFHNEEMAYETVLELDGKLRDSLGKLPEVFRFGQKSQEQYASLYRQRPAFAWQRCMLQLGYHFRFCRLHRRYFVRGAKDPRYSYSHVVCLQSARTVIEVKRIMDEEDPVFVPSSSLIWAVMHHVFMAAVILLVDVCFNWEDVLAEKRKEEVLAACRMLTRAQQSSAVARRAVDAMMEVLQRHWRQGKGGEMSACAGPSASSILKDTSNFLPQVAYADPEPQLDAGAAPGCMDTQLPLEDVWAKILEGTACNQWDTPDWTDLLADLTDATFPGE